MHVSYHIIDLFSCRVNSREKGRLDEAITFYQEALQLNPNFVEAYNNLGSALQENGRFEEAITYYKKALQLNPNVPVAYYNLGSALHKNGHLDEAITYYQKALQLNPNNPIAYNNLGSAFQENGRLDEAITYYRKALQLNPNYANAYNNLGSALQEKKLFDEAISCYQKSLRLNPNSDKAYNNLGTAFKNKGQLDEAITCYQKALQLNPNSTNAHYNLGTVLKEQAKFSEAVAAYDRVLESDPNHLLALWSRCMAQIPIIYRDTADIRISRNRYTEELLKLRSSVSLKTPEDIEAALEAVGTQKPFFLAYQGLDDRELQQCYGELVCKIMSSGYPQFSIGPAMPLHLAREPLRVGVVSRFFYYHPVWKTIIKGWIENLDKRKLHLFGYYTGGRKDKETDKAKQYFIRFIENIYSFDDLCKTILDSKLHVIIYPEIGMDPVTIKLAALRLAPIQCAAWGHPDTSGLPTIDYYLSSELMEPPDGDGHYTEQLVRLPNLSIHYTPHEISSAEVSRKTLGLRPKSILYHCCQTLFKFLPQYDEIFPRIAQQVGECQFLFSSLPEIPTVIEQFRVRIYEAFARFNLNAADYVVFLPYLDQIKYNAFNRISDIFLDPIGWSGCTSTLEAIDCNLPVITYPSSFMRGRESAAILRMIGLKETIVSSLDEYVELAAKLGQDSEWRHRLSEKIAQNKYVVYGDRACITALEDFIERVVNEKHS
jgi:predicted O-linked N-acetylglucosamine transferase (SPINDLY family)